MRAWVILVCGLAGCNVPAPNLSTTEQLAVVVGPPSTSFGSVAINTTSAPATFTVSPAGSGESDQTIMSIIGCDGFEITAPGVPGAQVFKHCGGLEPEQPSQQQPEAVVEQAECPSTSILTYSFTASFAPKVTGNLSCTAQIVMNNGTQTFRMDGTGVLPPFAIDVRPRNINFGDIRVSDTSDLRTIVIANAGANDLDVTTSYTGPEQIKLTKGPLGAHKIPKSASEGFELQCAPSGPPATHQAVLSIASNDPLTPKIDVPINCRGIDSELAIAPTSFTTAMKVNDDPVEGTVTLKNEGDAIGVIRSIAFGPGTHPDVTFSARPADGAQLSPNQTAEIKIKYAATSPFASAELGTVIVEFDEDEPRTITISGEAKLANVASDPPSIAFGPVCANVATTQMVDVYGTADASFQVTGGTTEAPFAVADLLAPKDILPFGDGRQTFSVSITPDEPTTAGTTVTGTLTIQNDAPLQNNFAIPMTAQPLRTGITTTEELSLGTAELGSFTPAQPITFTNCSDTAVMISEEPRILGANASEFTLSKVFQPIMVQRAETIEMDVVFAPKAPGQRVAELEIVYTGGVSTIALVGDGLGEIDGRDTYYACSTGSDAAWPIGFVVLVIRRRRRR